MTRASRAGTVRRHGIAPCYRWLTLAVAAVVLACHADGIVQPDHETAANATVIGTVSIRTARLGAPDGGSGEYRELHPTTITNALKADVVDGIATVVMDGKSVRARAFVATGSAPTRGPLVDTLLVPDTEHGVSQIILSRAATGEPVSRIEQRNDGVTVAAVDFTWRRVAGGLLLTAQTVTAFRRGQPVAMLRADFRTQLVRSPLVSLMSVRRALRSVARLFTPETAYAYDCGAEATALAAAGWASYLACGGGVLLLTPQCGAALLGYTAASWFLADCVNAT